MRRVLVRSCRWGCGFEDPKPKAFELRPAEILPCPVCGRPLTVREVKP